jgi:hypothetical protein
MSRDPLRRELGGFLRAAREHTAPADVGLSTGARRRTPGLRREEVAALSGVSIVGELRDAVPDWPRLVRGLYGQFRTGTDRLSDDPRVGDIRRLLSVERPDLAHWWRCRSVSDFAPTTLKVGGVSMTLSMLRPVASTDALLLAHPRGRTAAGAGLDPPRRRY